MRPFPIVCCALAVIFGSAKVVANAQPAGGISALMAELAKLPESKLKTECAFEDPYRRTTGPSSAGYSVSPEYKRYLQCLLSEARRNGGRLRLASARSFPKVGRCYSARITQIGSRFDGEKPGRDSGTTVEFSNGLSLVDYSYLAAVARSRVGDAVHVCVYALPEECPGDDLRGIDYRSRNLRTGESWIMSDSQHSCRGA